MRAIRGSRRKWLLAPALVIALTSGISYAFGADTIETKADTNAFSTGTFSMSGGETPLFDNTSSTSHAPHNVTAATSGGSIRLGPDGKPLFRTATIGDGDTPVSVAGAKYLPAATYHFICTVHGASMSADLVVAAGGMPLARPAIAETVRSRSLASVINHRKLKVNATSSSATGAPGAKLVAKLGSHKISRTLTVHVPPNGTRTAYLRLTSSGRKRLKAKLEDGKNARVRAYGSVSFGSSTKSALKTLR